MNGRTADREIRFTYVETAIITLSIAMLMFEILQTITISLQAFQHNAFLVISFCLMGLGGGGSLATMMGKRSDVDPVQVMWWSAFLFSLTLAVTAIAASRTVSLPLLIIFGFIPYIFAGLFLAFLFRAWPERANRSYFLNLVGSGIGCLGLVWLLNGTGDAALVILFVAALAMSAAVLLGAALPKRRVLLPLVAMALLLLAIPFRGNLFLFPPAPSKGMGILVNQPGVETNVSWSKWGYLGRLDVVKILDGIENFPHVRSVALQADMDAGCDVAILFAAAGNWTAAIDFKGNAEFRDRFVRDALYSAPYIVTDEPDVLNIGFGGGVDIFLALQNGARSVTGVDINPLMVEAGRKGLPGYYSDFYNDPRLDVRIMDGRTFVKSTKKKFDAITMTAVDTGELLHSNAKVNLEGYLYTQEAFDDYLDVLKDGGFIYVHRPYREMMRLAVTGIKALRRAGVEHPENHVAVLGRDISTAVWGSVLIGKKALTGEQQQVLRETYAGRISYLPADGGSDERFSRFFAAVAAGKEDEYLSTLPYNLEPVTDDSPFFYRFGRSRNGLMVNAFFLRLLIMVGAIALALIILPLVGTVPGGEGISMNLLRTLLYFGAIGCGFMLIEICLIQKLVLFLGHPSYSVTVTLFAILIFSGLGSIFGRRFDARSRRTAFIIWVPILAAAVLYASGIAPLLDGVRVDSLWARFVLVVLLLAPGSFFMGMPFPTMIRQMQGERESLILWAWGVNSFLSVAASILTIILAMEIGFSRVLYLGGAFYVLAFVMFLLSIRPKRAAENTS